MTRATILSLDIFIVSDKLSFNVTEYITDFERDMQLADAAPRAPRRRDDPASFESDLTT